MDHRCIALILLLFVHGTTSQSNLSPVFEESDDKFTVAENTPEGRLLTTLRANDPEGNPITFSLSVTDFFRLVQTDPNTVQILFNSNLDYEQTPEVRLTVTARDDVSNSNTDFEIVVTVTDVNDNKPEFSEASSFSLSEQTEVGYVIQNAFFVTDADTGRNAELNITCFVDTDSDLLTQDACNTFSLSTTRLSNGNYSVHITLEQPLDYEITNNYIMAVQAQDNNPPYNRDSKNIVIQVIDAQDMKPVFIGGPYSFFPLEELPVGSVIDGARIQVYDGDRGAQPARNLRLELLNDTRGWFTLSRLVNNSGVFTSDLTVASRMNREEYRDSSIYTIAVRVYELRPDGSVDLEATRTSTITINLLDINDNGPVFYTGTTRVTAPLNLEIDEGLGVNTPLPGFMLLVIDEDTGINQFDLALEGQGSETFELSPIAGTGSAVLSLSVRLEDNIDYESLEHRNMQLRIIATERSDNPKYTNEVELNIHLRDKNDNSPIFQQGRYDTSISSQLPAGSVLAVEPRAIDADSSGDFGLITYSLGQQSELFSINPTTGLITLLDTVPENVDTIELELVATDGGGRSNTATLVITVRDDNAVAPQFDSHIYNATVIENRAVFERPIQVQGIYEEATDEDNSGTLLYSIVSGNTEDGTFLLHPVSGRLTLRRPLTKADGHQFNLTVEVSDGGDDPLTDRAVIIVDLLDSNDHDPIFTQPSYSRSVSEITPVGTVLFNITAQDGDGPDEAGGRLTYSILSGDNSQRFSIDPMTGVMSINAELDYNREPRYLLKVEARDGGIPSRSSIIDVNITVTDANNKLPRFQSPIYVQYMNEDASPGTHVLSLEAIDSDANAELRYSIEPNSYTARDPSGRAVASTAAFRFRSAFTINERTGDISTLLPFNYDAVNFISFRVRATDVNAEDPAIQEGFAEVQVNIRQEGVGTPEFLNEPWTPNNTNIYVNVTEGIYGHILTLVARDSLTGEIIQDFRITSDVENLFTILSSGEVILNRPFDYETMGPKSRSVVVEARSPTGQTAVAVLTINVQNVNDNMPSFERDVYVYREREGLVVADRFVGTVRATDGDGDHTLRYRVSGRDSRYFYITDRGDVYLRNGTLLDAETRLNYTIYVQATDQNGEGETIQVPVRVNVENTNEFAPVCDQEPFSFYIPQSIVVPSDVGIVSATDADLGDTLMYSLERVNEDLFDIDPINGKLTLIQLPDWVKEQGIYSLAVNVRDDSNIHFTRCNVTIVLTSTTSNNLPRFVNPPNDRIVYNISEGAVVNSTLTTIEVVNADNSPVERVNYTLANTTYNNQFRVDPRTGRVYVVDTPDRETQQDYQLVVIANTDEGQVSRRFYVNITDVDDNKPSFDCRNYTTPLTFEAVMSQSSIDQLIGQIQACDDDLPPNNKIYYHLVECANGTSSEGWRSWYSINVTTGQISVQPRFLNAATTPQYTLCVNASTSPFDASLNAAQWKVAVNVRDESSNVAEFLQDEVSVLLSSSATSNEDLIQIQTSSRVGQSTVSYSITSIEYTDSSGATRTTTEITNAFSIDSTSGKVLTGLSDYATYLGGKFTINILLNSVNSQGVSAQDTMKLQVYVTAPEEQIILVFKKSPDEVREFLPEFLQELKDLHDIDIKVQKIAYHEDPNTKTTYLNMTDVYIYGLFKNGTLVPYSKLVEIFSVSYHPDHLELFSKYGLIEAVPMTQASSSRIEGYGGLSHEWMWWIVLICAIVLIIDAIILIGCLVYLWQKHVVKPSAMAPVYYNVQQ